MQPCAAAAASTTAPVPARPSSRAQQHSAHPKTPVACLSATPPAPQASSWTRGPPANSSGRATTDSNSGRRTGAQQRQQREAKDRAAVVPQAGLLLHVTPGLVVRTPPAPATTPHSPLHCWTWITSVPCAAPTTTAAAAWGTRLSGTTHPAAGRRPPLQQSAVQRQAHRGRPQAQLLVRLVQTQAPHCQLSPSVPSAHTARGRCLARACARRCRHCLLLGDAACHGQAAIRLWHQRRQQPAAAAARLAAAPAAPAGRQLVH